MRAILPLVLASAILAGCATTNTASDLKELARKRWAECVISENIRNTKRYDDPQACANLAILECGVHKSSYASQVARSMGESSASIVADQVEERMRRDLVARAQQLIYQAQLKEQNQPIPLDFR